MKENFFKQKKVTGIFSALALITGYMFLDKNITGNIILNTKYSFSLVSLIGLGLIICSLLLAYNTLKK